MDAFDFGIERFLKPKDGSFDYLNDRVSELRILFKHEYEQNQDLYDARDLVRFIQSDDDWYARRWIIYRNNVSKVFELLKQNMKRRKNLGLNDLSYEDFPREFFELAVWFGFGHDRRGRKIMYMVCRKYKSLSDDIREMQEKFTLFLLDQCEKRAKSNGFVLVFDVSGCGLSNILIVGLPWVLNPLMKVILSMVPEHFVRTIKLINKEELNHYIDHDQIPTSMGGTSKTKFQIIPSKTKSITDFRGISKGSADKLRKLVESEADPNGFEIVDVIQVIS